ncbi:MAG TPA: hypothetical protein VK698_16130 [Kofleriaceae bacterium]|nr:hypothetical protein [Kofleriaceae bacterium]
MRRLLGTAAITILFATTACDSVGSAMDDDGYQTLAETDWELEGGSELYLCIRKTIDEDMLIGGFEAIAPPGTHHTVVTVGAADGPDGVRRCGSYDHHFEQFVFESSGGANRFELPQGLAARIPAGQQVNINIHILNTTDEKMTGTTGDRIKLLDPNEVQELATSVYMGKLTLDIPPGESTQTGNCQLSNDVTLFGVLPHMHSFGSHMKVIAKSSVEGDVVVHDEPFYFDTTKFEEPIDPVVMKRGDQVEVQCSYQNPTGQTLRWGQDSYSAEMCFAAMYLYPAEGQTSACAY